MSTYSRVCSELLLITKYVDGFVANIIGARAGSPFMPAFETDMNNEPTRAASAAIAGYVVPTLEDVPQNPARQVFGVLYEAKGENRVPIPHLHDIDILFLPQT